MKTKKPGIEPYTEKYSVFDLCIELLLSSGVIAFMVFIAPELVIKLLRSLP